MAYNKYRCIVQNLRFILTTKLLKQGIQHQYNKQVLYPISHFKQLLQLLQITCNKQTASASTTNHPMCIWEDVEIVDCRNGYHSRRITADLNKQPTTLCAKARGHPCGAVRKHTKLLRQCALCNIVDFDTYQRPPPPCAKKVETGAAIKDGGSCVIL